LEFAAILLAAWTAFIWGGDFDCRKQLAGAFLQQKPNQRE